MPPADPKRLKAINRVQTVLKAIQAGDNYFKTPYEVVKRALTEEECRGFPTYQVFADIGEGVQFAGYHLYNEKMTIFVFGICSHHEDPVTENERCIRDIRKAIKDDSQSSAPESLKGMGCITDIKECPVTGYQGTYGFLRQKINIEFSGDFGEL
ncbi:MAG: hypothetical protein JSW41_01465 [Candidatus Aenigmatarchaeota archaeon]|nr:MAG: hypothetical protein JSW41_01465 [Candidatus Aenigmarchaeota archaeon]